MNVGSEILKQLKQVDELKWDLPTSFKKGMKVPARFFATENILKTMDNRVFDQIANVASLPGIVKRALCMPDAHSGYGFPIGGVAAFDPEEGVISPGGIGFDINCLKKGTPVLDENGANRPIEELTSQTLNIIDLQKKKLTSAKVILTQNKKPLEPVFEITTGMGNTLTATEDHPVYTERGMVALGKLQVGDKVAVCPFKGTKYEDATEWAQKYGISAEQAPTLAKICAYNMGDGTLLITANKYHAQFYGPKKDLMKLQQDIKKIGFSPTKVYTRVRNHKINTKYGLVKFKFEENSFNVNGKKFYDLLKSLGVPNGRKTDQGYRVPEWVRTAPKWIKRCFLASYFGAEMNAPSVMKENQSTFYMQSVGMNKIEEFTESARQFLQDISDMLLEFGLKSTVSLPAHDYDGIRGSTYRTRLHISNTLDQLRILFSEIGFEYSEEKQIKACYAAHYLAFKEEVIKLREKAQEVSILMYSNGQSTTQIANKLHPAVNKRFVQRSVFEKRGSIRTPENFPNWEEFIADNKIGNNGLMWDVIMKKDLASESEVYDITVNHKDHNFLANGFLVSNCGMRLLRTNLTTSDVKPKIKTIIDNLFKTVPAGVGCKGFVKLSREQFNSVMTDGVKWCVENDYGWEKDLNCIEDYGCISWADPKKVSQRAISRGIDQLGTLGSGNHYLEVQMTTPGEIFDKRAAKAMGITSPDQIMIMIHCGSRGFGHQIGTDYLKTFETVMKEHKISISDPELSCAPFQSKEGQDYFGAMACAANMAFANRQVIVHRIRECFASVFKQDAESLGLDVVYDVAHNIAKLEKHKIDGKMREVLVHRKGATRAFGPGRSEIPAVYRDIGQPVIVGGSMETGSYLLVGTKKAEEETFGSTMHGSGRLMSRTQAKHDFNGEKLQKDMAKKGIYVQAVSMSGLAEEAGASYKNIDEVIDTMHIAGITTKVAKLRPIGNVKG